MNSKGAISEIWVSLASLLKSYTALHGLSGEQQATVESDVSRILVRHGERWLDLERHDEAVSWKRSDGSHGTLELTEEGRLRGAQVEDEMDMAAEAWARELMK